MSQARNIFEEMAENKLQTMLIEQGRREEEWYGGPQAQAIPDDSFPWEEIKVVKPITPIVVRANSLFLRPAMPPVADEHKTLRHSG